MTLVEHPPASGDEREALEFLKTGRKLRGLSPTQFQRIEHRLAYPKRPLRSRRWLPALAAVSVALLAGAAVGHVVDLSRLPFVGSLFPSQKSSPPMAPRPRTRPEPLPSSHGNVPATNMPAVEHAGDGEPTPALERAELPQAPRRSAPLPTTVAHAARSDSGRSLSLASPRGSERAMEPRVHGTVREELVPPETPALTPPPPPMPAPAMPGPLLPAPTAPAPTAAAPMAQLPTIPAWSTPRPSTAAPSTPSPREDPISAESQSFSAALAQWHRDHNAEAALAALDLHERRFPHGQIRLEAKLLRAEILLQQGRGREALSLLDGVSLSGLPRGRELQTVRGELRVKFGRCAEGRRDLEHVLVKDRTDALGRRATRALLLCP
jgi:hypothetical protein